MADAYWRYGDGRPQQAALAPLAVKRPRPDFEMPSSHELSNYYAHPDDKASLHVTRDTDSINASYDRYLRNTQMSSHGNDAGRPVSTVLGGPRHVDDPHVMTMGGSDLAVATMSRPVGARGRSELKLPLDASSTLYVEGLPTNCSRREVSHIFRPFVGYKEVRLVTKEPRQSGGDSMVLCFVDFVSPAHAATAMDALQGYKFDEHDRESAILRLQFARYPGARSGAGNRGKR